jgi:small subunit ribosomal protein S3Ae
MVRRGSSSIRLIKNFTTRDQAIVQAQIVVFTIGRLNTSRKQAIRSITDEVVAKKATELTYNQFAQEAVLGKIASDIYNAAKKISRLRHVGVSKTKLIKKASIEVEDMVTIKPEPEMPEEVEEVDVAVTTVSSS